MIRRVAAVAALLVLLAAGTATRLVLVHHDYDVWALAPGARTPTLPFHGRLYLLGEPGSVPDGAVPLGSAPGGGRILSLPPVPGADPTVLFVRYPDGTVASYVLSGGP
jgi:hypothetical protein